MARVFISHANKDLAIAVEVCDWLRDDRHEPFLAADLGGGIPVGEDWKQRLYRELRGADAVVCVVTEAFVESNWCAAEVGIADSLGCLLLPIQAQPGVKHPLMEHLQYTDRQAGANVVREQLGRALRDLDLGGPTQWRDGDNPFPGLAPFPSALSTVFFGRSDETRKLAGLLRAGARGRLTAVVGPSGCGKSSLLRAGLLPLLEREDGWLVIPPLLPGDDPLHELAATLAAVAHRLDRGWTRADIRQRLAKPDGLRTIAEDLAQGDRVLIAVDQAEELFTRAGEEDRATFGALLREAVRGPVRVVATLRSEFQDDLRTLPALAGLPIETTLLEPLSPDKLSAVITEPVRAAGLKVDPGLVFRLVTDTATGEALPLLAFTLQQLALDLTRGDRLSATRYRDMDGVHGALSKHADQVLADAVARSGLDADEVLTGLVRLVTFDGVNRLARRVDRRKLSEPLRAAFEVFVDQRLLTTTGNRIGVAHEALLTKWPPLIKAIDERAAVLRAVGRVERAAAEWVERDRAESFLWEQGRLDVAEEALTPDPPALDDDSRAFLAATRARLDTLKRQGNRRRRRSLLVLSVLLALALGATALAGVQWGSARHERDTATARALVAQAEAARDGSPRLALRLGIAAHRLRPSAETNAGLVNTLITTRYAGSLTGPETDGLSASAFSTDGRTLITGTSTGRVTLWDLADVRAPRRLDAAPQVGSKAVTSLAVGAGVLAVGGSDGVVTLWDLSTPANPREFDRITEAGPVTAVAFTADGRTLAIGKSDGSATLWDLTDPEHPVRGASPVGHDTRISSAAFAPNGVLATSGDDGTVVLWDLSDPGTPRREGEPLTDQTRRSVTSIAFAPKSGALVTARSDGTVNVWDVTGTPRQVGDPLAAHSAKVTSVAFAPGTDTLATGSEDGAAVLWDLRDPTAPKMIGEPLVGHRSHVTSVAFPAGGTTLVTSGVGGGAILWDLTELPKRIGDPLTGHGKLVKSTVFEGDELVTTGSDGVRLRWDVRDPHQPRQLGRDRAPGPGRTYSLAVHGTVDATPGTDNTVLLWDITDPAKPRPHGRPLTGHRSAINAVAFRADGAIVAAGGTDGTTILWDVTDPDKPRRLGQPPTEPSKPVTSLAFSPDGGVLAAGGSDGTVILWDISDPNRPRRLGRALAGHSMAVNAVAFAPSGKVLATSGSDGTTLLWDLSPFDDVAAKACAAGGGLDRDEWRQYVPDLDYRETCPA
ncbi:hypothetical protein GCM10022243_19600 [Saccharothrix violaceirubra]|uniref:WD40 repeat protein/energy-coupling factor transporter ATP-binding protein EcfA2 n=1 Tax=Saccharothrix violaceirubra TaxID=413306 RepID=A0A7W7WW31_9PSEU|nr:TIR domain-containing protein [Saccharothrix violaceirubra]MBB4965133.1 WD40 repeat protein/energy-coupling factor transporter ATP-binding protein EcfA2 [Saccharothrix violaceirubra]